MVTGELICAVNEWLRATHAENARSASIHWVCYGAPARRAASPCHWVAERDERPAVWGTPEASNNSATNRAAVSLARFWRGLLAEGSLVAGVDPRPQE
ncbi:protein of unknown function [Hyphomicrobium sp. 1Nfss2.1]